MRRGGTRQTSGSSPSRRPSARPMSARRSRPASETSARTACRRASTKLRASLTWPSSGTSLGHLQSNKAAKAARAFQWIHSVDSRELVGRLDRAAADAGVRPQVLVQVDLAHEATKSGADAAIVPDIVQAALDSALDLRGLIIVPPLPIDPEDSRRGSSDPRPAGSVDCPRHARPRLGPALDGHEPRLPHRDRGGRNNRPRRHRDLRAPARPTRVPTAGRLQPIAVHLTDGRA